MTSKKRFRGGAAKTELGWYVLFCRIAMGHSLEQMVQRRLCVAVEMAMLSEY